MDDDGSDSESPSASALDAASPLVLSSPRGPGHSADCENLTLSDRVEKLEALVGKQQQQLESQGKLVLQLQQQLQQQPQQQLQQQPQMFQYQPAQYQFPPFVPNQWSTSQAAQAAQPNTIFIYDIPNKKE